MLQANKTKKELDLAPHEWQQLYTQLESITKNGANSIQHLEGMVLILLDEIKKRLQ